jgi:H+-transporting ATPase
VQSVILGEQNRLTVEALRTYPPFSQLEVLRFAAFASNEATQDPIDLVILSRAKDEGLLSAVPHRLKVVPFDSATKLSETVLDQGGQALCGLKGTPQAIIHRLGGNLPGVNNVEQLSAQGYRVLVVAAGPQHALRIVGLLALREARAAAWIPVVGADSSTRVKAYDCAWVSVILDMLAAYMSGQPWS